MSKALTVGDQLAEILDDFRNALDEAVEKDFNEVATESVQKLRNSSPKRPGGGSYAKGWRKKKERDGSVIVHNATDYQLTHLLENGHVIANKWGTYGRTNGIKHIAPVEEWANGEVVQRITADIEKGL